MTSFIRKYSMERNLKTKETLEKLPICTYKKNKFIFDKTTGISNGGYIIIRNKIDDFSLYKADSFKVIEEKLLEESSKKQKRRI